MARATTSIHPKVAGGAVAGAFSVLLLYLLDMYASFRPPSGVAAAITTIITFVVAYFIPSGDT